MIMIAALLNRNGSPTGYSQWIFAAGEEWGVEEALIKAIISVESGWDSLGYNDEGLHDPRQGSFGLGQIQHTDTFSWVRRWNLAGNWPTDLYKPDINIDLTARILAYFKSKGYGLESIDVYNVGETAWSRGVRNESYRRKVKKAYDFYVGI